MATIDPGALLIGLREGLEALLVLGILLGMLHRFGHPEKARLLWAGAGLGVVASLLAGFVINAYVASWFEEQGGAALFEVIVALSAVGILTYMVLWMQKHTTDLLGAAKRAVATAVEDGRWVLLGTLAFVTVFREGLETVLFFAARSGDVGWDTLALSGLAGFAASGAIAFAIFRLTVKVDLRRFFAITGTLLIFVAAGLLVHIVHAAADLGWIGHGTPLWDTSGVLPDEDHWLGGPLHALVGYEDQPTALGLLLYLGYIVGVGGWYASRLATGRGRKAARTGAAAAMALLLAGFALAGAVPAGGGQGGGHGHGLSRDAHDGHAIPHDALVAEAQAALAASGAKVGVLVRAHGEPVHYNASTYASFKAFIDGIWDYTGLPRELLQADHGTVLIDAAHPWDEAPRPDARLVDAWLGNFTGAAVPMSDPAGLHDIDETLANGQFYLAPGPGPGWGEGDLYEVLGLGAYRTWLKMENRSPMHDATSEAMQILGTHLAKHFGPQVTFAHAYHMDPKVSPDETLEAALDRLVAAGAEVLVDAYMSSVHSDGMETCMMRGHMLHAAHEAGFHGRIIHAGMAGTQPAWAKATADYAETLAASLPEATPLAIQLAQHGARPDGRRPCGTPEERAQPDMYHRNARAEFLLAKAAVQERLPGVRVDQVYGQGADATGDGVLSPQEALDAARADGAEAVLVIPYEFWGNAMDNLVPLREAFGFAPEESPYYGPGHETRFTSAGTAVWIASARFGMEDKATALLAVVSEAMAAGLADHAEAQPGSASDAGRTDSRDTVQPIVAATVARAAGARTAGP